MTTLRGKSLTLFLVCGDAKGVELNETFLFNLSILWDNVQLEDSKVLQPVIVFVDLPGSHITEELTFVWCPA